VGKYPFEAETVYLLYKKIEEEPVRFSKSLDCYLSDLLQKMLEKDPEKRATAKELLEHEWFIRNDVSILERLQDFFKSCF